MRRKYWFKTIKCENCHKIKQTRYKRFCPSCYVILRRETLKLNQKIYDLRKGTFWGDLKERLFGDD